MDRQDILNVIEAIRSGSTAGDLESDVLDIKDFPLVIQGSVTRPNHQRLADMVREYAVCFANAQGGTILLGIRDRVKGPRAITGCFGYDIDDIKRAVYDGTVPPLTVDVVEITIEEGTLLAVRVPKSPRIHSLQDGRRLRRVGRECRAVLPGDDVALEVEKGGDFTAKLLYGVGMEAVDPLEVHRLRRWISRYRPGAEILDLEDLDLLKGLHLVVDGPRGPAPTIACVLLVGNETSLADRLPQNEIRYAVFEHDETQPVQDVSLRLPLLATIDRLLELIQPYNRVTTIRDGLLELPIPSFPEEVVREGLLNAVIHRSYVEPEGINVRLYEERLEIGNPGGFIGGITPSNILTHEPRRRNPLLAETLQHVGAVNRLGLGVDRMYKLLLSYGKAPPEYIPQESAVTLVIRDGSVDEPLARYVGKQSLEGHSWSVEELIVLRYLRVHDSIQSAQAAELCQRPQSHASTLLARMEGRLLERFGTGRGTYYRLSRNVYEALGAVERFARDRGIDETRQLELIRRHLREYGGITNDVAQRICGINRNQAYRLLKRLVESNELEQPTRGRNASYRVPGR